MNHPVYQRTASQLGNALIDQLDQRKCTYCGHEGLDSSPFAVHCPRCNGLMAVSVSSMPLRFVPPKGTFYIAGDRRNPFVEWERGRWVVDGTHANARAKIDGLDVYIQLPSDCFVVPALPALIADRFSIN